MTSRMFATITIVAMGLGSDHLAAKEAYQLKNKHLCVSLNEDGLQEIQDLAIGTTIGFDGDHFDLTVDGKSISDTDLTPTSVEHTDTSVTYHYRSDDWPIRVVYELQPEWRFISKHIAVSLPHKHTVNRVTVFDAALKSAPTSQHLYRGGSYGGLFRFNSDNVSWGMFAVLQNPFCKLSHQDQHLALAYLPKMEWKAEYGEFQSDRVCLGTYEMSGTTYPAEMRSEWEYVRDVEAWGRSAPQVDINETLALIDCVSAFTTYKPKESIRLHVDWCENAYQLDVSLAEDWVEYQRIIRRAADMGCNYILYSPKDESITSQSENRDAWGWEQLLWMNLGPRIRTGDFLPGTNPIPPPIKNRVSYAAEHGVQFIAYAYPTVPFMQDPDWTAWIRRLPGSPEPGGYRGPDTGKRSFQDWLVKNLIAFKQQAGLGGYSFDHWWIAYGEDEVDSSQYAQWKGCQQVLLRLRNADPDIVLDGRQQYHQFGPWTWLGGSFPHPMASDEQPGSFRAFPDLHFSRVSANRTRSRNYWYFWHNFCPVELMPGFTTHQTMRSDENGVMRRDPYRLADWDYLGWKYSVISSIGTAPINHIINYLPARSIAEFDNFTHNDIKWHRDWLDWTDKHFATLQHLRPILGQPMIGKCDATAAIDGDQGFVFVFNPNYRRLSAEFQLDESIGLTAGDHLVLRQLYPDALKGKLLGRPGKSTYQFGDTVSLEMAGASAAVFAVEPADDQQQPLLLNANGKATLTDDSDLMLSGVIGEYGETVQASAVVPTGKQIHRLIVNGIELPFDQGNELVTFQLQFSGQSFSNVQQIGRYDPRLTDNQFEGTSSLPTRIIKQLDSRKKTWPISYNAEELKATWNAPWRKLLFVNIADPSEEMELSASVNGQPLPLKRAYTDIYGYGKNQTLVGWYADLSGIIEADQEFKLDLRLPDNLRPGQFQGVFFDNVEAEYTNELATPEKNPAATARGPT